MAATVPLPAAPQTDLGSDDLDVLQWHVFEPIYDLEPSQATVFHPSSEGRVGESRDWMR